jgi:predicted nuclease of restriction endonuclease-like (RecB) superfamily
MKKVSNLKNNVFDRVVSILEEARSNVFRAVNSNMVIAYWLIGREIVEAIQAGGKRASYGKKVIEDLSEKLTKKYKRGFSTTNLRYFRTFYLVYIQREPTIRQIQSGVLKNRKIRQTQSGVLENIETALKKAHSIKGFSPNLGWSHYQLLMSIENKNERLFYEIEAEKELWEVEHLKRQIDTFLFARLLKSRDKKGVIELSVEGIEIKSPIDVIRNPYVLDFFGLPEKEIYHESDMENAIIDNIQSFLLELGKGFSFVARQKHIRFDDDDFYIDLVFYNYILKCFVLIDLKIGRLTHRDVGQMDGYVRMFESVYKTESDNPTIGLILCTEKKESVAKYSVLNDGKQIFASKYMLYLPTESELKKIIQQEQDKISNREK